MYDAGFNDPLPASMPHYLPKSQRLTFEGDGYVIHTPAARRHLRRLGIQHSLHMAEAIAMDRLSAQPQGGGWVHFRNVVLVEEAGDQEDREHAAKMELQTEKPQETTNTTGYGRRYNRNRVCAFSYLARPSPGKRQRFPGSRCLDD